MFKLLVISVYCVALSVLIVPIQSRKIRNDLTTPSANGASGTGAASESGSKHRHEEIFLPLKVEPDGTVDGLLIEDNEAEKGPLVIEEILNESGEVTEVVVERIGDLSPDRLPRRQATNRKLGGLPPVSPTSNTGSEQGSQNSANPEQGTNRKKQKSLLPLILVLISTAFVVGFLLSAMFWRGSSLDRFMLDKKSRLALNKKLSLKPEPWKDEKDLYSPTRRSMRSPTHRGSAKQAIQDHKHNHI